MPPRGAREAQPRDAGLPPGRRALAPGQLRLRAPGEVRVESGDFLRGHRSAEEEALAELAAALEHELALLLRLDSLGEGVEAQAVGELDHRRHKHGGVQIVRKTAYEGSIDLQRGDVHLAESSERGVTSAEIVDRELEASLVDLGQYGSHGAPALLHDRRFSDLDHQSVGVQSERLDCPEDM